MKISRLLEITILLLNRRTITAKELAERFEVSTRTIYRDVDILSCAGVPVYTSKGNGGGISLLEGYALNRTLISEHESESLLLALKTLQATQYPQIDEMLGKLGSIFKSVNSDDWVSIDFSPWGSAPNEYNKYIDIKKAILERRTLTFDYVNSEGDRSRRHIEPMRLIFKSQAWYLWGYCKMKEGFRVFRISRMKQVVVTNETFERRKYESRQSSAEVNEKKPVELKLRFLPFALHRIYDDFDDERIIRNEDGTCNVSVTFPEDEWVYGYLLSFGCYVEVLEPEHIRKILADRMKKALLFYNEPIKLPPPRYK